LYFTCFRYICACSIANFFSQFGRVMLNVRSAVTESMRQNVISQKTGHEIDAMTSRSWRLNQLKNAVLKCTNYQCPLVLHGPPGSGRTYMVAAINEMYRRWLSSENAVVISRVLGTSPGSNTIDYVLSTVCHQICEVCISFCLN
jgi:hypothetical protein